MRDIFSRQFFSESGQQAMEAVLIFVIVVVVLFAALAPGGFFTRNIEKSMHMSTRAAEWALKSRNCYEGSTETTFSYADWGECIDGRQYIEFECASGCCFPLTPLMLSFYRTCS